MDTQQARQAVHYQCDWKSTGKQPSEAKLSSLVWQSTHGRKATTSLPGMRLPSLIENHTGR